MRYGLTFGFLFPARRWNQGCPGAGRGGPRCWPCSPPAVPLPAPAPAPGGTAASPGEMRGAGSPRGQREPLSRLSELSMEGSETAT